MATTVQMTAPDDHKFAAYHVPAGGEHGRRGGIVVIQEIFGVNGHIRAVADGYAAEGYEVYAPALFDRLETGIELGYEQSDIERGLELRGQLDDTWPVLDVQACVAQLRQQGEVGIVGYCFGGLVSWLTACRAVGVTAAVCYYGGGIAKHVDLHARGPVMMHFGERDAAIPMSDVQTVRDRHPEVEVHTYDADHGFNCDHRGSFDADAAKLARERTLAFFADHVG